MLSLLSLARVSWIYCIGSVHFTDMVVHGSLRDVHEISSELISRFFLVNLENHFELECLAILLRVTSTLSKHRS